MFHKFNSITKKKECFITTQSKNHHAFISALAEERNLFNSRQPKVVVWKEKYQSVC